MDNNIAAVTSFYSRLHVTLSYPHAISFPFYSFIYGSITVSKFPKAK